MQLSLYIALIFLILNYGQTEVNNPSPLPEEIYLPDDSIYTWTSPNYPNSYNEIKQSIIKVDPGYKISVTVEILNLHSNGGDYLIVKSGNTLEGEGDGKVFVYHLDSPRNYVIYSNQVFVSLHIDVKMGNHDEEGENEKEVMRCLLKFKRIGEPAKTTTESPTTAIPFPTPSPTDLIYYTGYVSGKTQQEFSNNETLFDFRTALARAAIEYCTRNSIPLSENITDQNVQINYLIQCPYNWPNSETCMKVRFSLPIFLDVDPEYTGYQLNASHLELMWNDVASKYLKDLNTDIYSVPDDHRTLVKWVVISCIVVIAFLILLYFVKMTAKHFSPISSGKLGNDDFQPIKPKTSIVSLAPHPYQTTPALFDNDYGFSQFEVDLGNSNTGYTFPLSEEESDIDEEMFTKNRNPTDSTKEGVF